MRVELHSGPLAEALPGWEGLVAADPDATPFSSTGWASAWCNHFLETARPWLLLVREGEELVGLAPLVLRRRGRFRVLRALGEGPADYWDVIAPAGRRAEVAAAVAGALGGALRSEWDILDLKLIPQGSSTPAALGAAGLTVQRSATTACPGIELPPTFDDYLRSLPQARRTNLRRRLRHLDDGALELREVRAAEDLPRALDRWQALRVAQWRETGKELMPEHASDRFRAFVLEVVERLLPSGQALVWELLHEGEVVGSYVNFVDQRAFYQYLGGFDTAVARLGVGKVATGAGIRASVEQGRRYYDFMVGAEPYKYWFGASDRLSTSVVCTNRRSWSRLAFAARELLERRPAR